MNSEITQWMVSLMLTSFRRSNLDATSLPTGHGGGILCDEPEVFGDPAVQNGLVSPRPASAQPPRTLHYETGEKEGSAVTKTIHVTSNTTKEIVIFDPDPVGIPSEGNWNVTNAYMFRFCFEHRQKEWLLVYADRWMRPCDFNVYDAQTKLEVKLQKYQREPWSLEPDLPNSQVECGGTLWSHLDTPTQRGIFGDEDIYLCRWKFPWTLETDIDDKDWAQNSCRAQDERIGRRRSARVEKTAACRITKFEQMMDVVNLENYL
jgi:hypothetical protein